MVKERVQNGGLVTAYVVGHLCTFSINKEEAKDIVSIGAKKLREQEDRNHLWPQNLILKVDEYSIQLESTDEDGNKELIEKFPISAVTDCQGKQFFIESKYFFKHCVDILKGF
jgi:hypothetical protein